MHYPRYMENFELTKDESFAEYMTYEIQRQFVMSKYDRITVCLHEKGDFYSPGYIRKWADVIANVSELPISYYVYTRSWGSPAFREELERMAARSPNVRINLSTDSEMVREDGVPEPIGEGLVTYMTEGDQDLPPDGVDLVFRNLRLPHDEPIERLGGTLVCPNESGLYVDVRRGRPCLKGGKTRRISCMNCRLCLDCSPADWDVLKESYRGVPGELPIGANVPGKPVEVGLFA